MDVAIVDTPVTMNEKIQIFAKMWQIGYIYVNIITVYFWKYILNIEIYILKLFKKYFALRSYISIRKHVVYNTCEHITYNLNKNQKGTYFTMIQK